MTFDEYQERAKMTAQYPNIGANPFYPTLGLCGESGEVAEKVKRIMRDQNGEMTPANKADIAVELGDVLWYLSTLATEIGVSLSHVAEMNLIKLASRKARNRIQGSGDYR
jgi:NTP pyrophosphatase (non-canonical NTP hydrolase)